MSTQPNLHFSKMHGAGNDFVILDLRNSPAPSSALCQLLADRHMGIGCDLILGVEEPRSARAAASYRIWTADGSTSQQCGNGARCVAAWIRRAGIIQGPRFALDSPSGTHAVEVLSGTVFRVSMGIPQFSPDLIPLVGFDQQEEWYKINFDDQEQVSFAAVSMGNPHAVIEVNNVHTAPVRPIGQALQASDCFPKSVNVGFAEVVSRDRILLRVYEYGAGETLACGSGACAAAAVLMRRGLIDRNVSVVLKGGELQIGWPEACGEMTMTGPAAFVFEGVLDPSARSPTTMSLPANQLHKWSSPHVERMAQ